MEQVEYTRTVVPSSMRSPYWKYFGFPSDSSNNILTRQKIVCTVCNTIIAYNKNTSNLRTHLMSKHVEIFKKIVPLPSDNVVQRRNSTHENCDNEGNKRQCVEIVDDGLQATASLESENTCVENFITLPEYESIASRKYANRENISAFATNKINYEMESTDFIRYFPPNGTEISEIVPADEIIKEKNVAYTINEEAGTYTDVGIPDENENQHHSVDIMLADFIQKDLLPLETLKNPGFCKYNQQVTGLKIDDDTVMRVKEILEARYANAEQTVACHVTQLSQIKTYSLSFEIYKDGEEHDVLNIYFNYLDEKQRDLISFLYTSCVICSTDISIPQLLSDINLTNCSGIVVTCLDEFQFISDFANIHGLPLTECLESVLSRCLKTIFEKTEFCKEYQKFVKTILENKNVIPFPKLNLRARCQWSPLIFLEYVFSNAKEEQIGKWDELRESFEYLKPLKLAMDVIMEEPLPLCSLTRPLIKKMFEEHFVSVNQKNILKSQIRKVLESELYERILAKTFLKEATFFDIRFHHDFALNAAFSDVTYLKLEIQNRFKNILQVTSLDQTCNVVAEQYSTDSASIRKCSSLKTFLKRGGSLMNADFGANLKTNFDLEFEQYYNQPSLDLDQSPVLWWEQHTDNFKQLSKIAKRYLTIPCCCVPRLCRVDLEKRFSKLDRRSNLSQFCNIESKLWYLNYNEDVCQFA